MLGLDPGGAGPGNQWDRERMHVSHRICMTPFACDELVLLHDTKLGKSYPHKLTFRCLGPFRIAEVYVVLKEFDRSIMRGTVNDS